VSIELEEPPKDKAAIALRGTSTAYGVPSDFLGNRFVYTVISPRAKGLTVGVNLNPDKACNFACIYCEVNRKTPMGALDVDVMAAELEATLRLAANGGLRRYAPYANLPESLLQLRHVAISGDGEPTLCPKFTEAVEALAHLRARGRVPFFKIVLLTNATRLDAPDVQSGLQLFTAHDEIWAKLDAGTQAYMNRINVSTVPLEKVLSNILALARQRAVIIQSLFPLVNGAGPSADEIEQYARRLKELKDAGAQIPLVQIYSATRPCPDSTCVHAPLSTLFEVARTVRRVTGLNAEVF
jgi:wyosine [tRNA(Phe)-imidazoG37] synthetase (radical SAM superfamily)